MAPGNAQTLLKNGIQAAQAGNHAAARQMFIQALKLDPQNETGWMWMVQVVETDKEREFCLKKILEINPNNQRAQQALAQLQSPPLPGWTQPSSPTQPSRPTQPARQPAQPDTLRPPAAPDDPFGAAANPFGAAPGLDIPIPGDEDIFGSSGDLFTGADDLFGGPPAEPAQPAAAAPDSSAGLGLEWPDAGDELGLAWPDEGPDDWASARPAAADAPDWPDKAKAATWGDWDAPAIEGDDEASLPVDDGLEDLREEVIEDKRSKPKREKKPGAKKERKPVGFVGRIVRLLIAALLLVAIVGVGYVAIIMPRMGGGAPPPDTHNVYQGETFSFKYPKDWLVASEAADAGMPVTLTRGELDLSAETPPEQYAYADVTVSAGVDQTAEAIIDGMIDEDAMAAEFISVEEREQGSVTIGGNEGRFAVFAVTDTTRQATFYVYAAAVVADNQTLSLYLESTDEADINLGKEIAASIALGLPAAAEVAADATETAAPEATPEATEEATPEVTPEATEEATPEATPEATAVAMLADAAQYEGEGYTLRYPEGWVVADKTEEDGTAKVSLSAELYDAGAPPSDPFTFVTVTTGPTGGNPAPVWAELLRAAAVEQVAVWDGTEIDADAALSLIDLDDKFMIGGVEGVFEHYTIDRGEAPAMHVFAGVAVMEDDPDRGFTLTLYTTDAAERATAEAMLGSVEFAAPEEVEEIDPEMYGPPPPPEA
ncbi:MAG: hypothetical protein JXB47_00720 [Anaerolineae bacterium]|nr:hypothetical protein [Anaerolineae bacterium]